MKRTSAVEDVSVFNGLGLGLNIRSQNMLRRELIGESLTPSFLLSLLSLSVLVDAHNFIYF